MTEGRDQMSRIERNDFRVALLAMGLALILCGWIGQAQAYDLELIGAQELQGEASQWVILDGRPKAEWQKSRLPGALSFSWEDYTRTDVKGVPYRIWYPHELARVLGEMGIDENTPVVVYGDADTSWGGEGWAAWALSWLGHQGPIRLLNGGIQAWQGAGLPLAAGTEIPSRPAAKYRFKERSELNISIAELQQRGSKVTLIDTRSGWEWFRGNLPGAIHIPWKDLLAGDDNRPLAPVAYRKLLAEKGVPTGQPVVFYCTGGIRSGYSWLIHQLSGLSDASNFEGGTEAWDRLAQ